MSSATEKTTKRYIHDSVDRSQKIILVTNLAKLLLSLALTVFLGRVLEPAEFGFFSLISSLLILAYTLSDLGTNDIAIREISDSPEQEKPILESFMALRFVFGSLLCVICLILATQQSDDGERFVLIALSVWVLFIFFNVLLTSFTVRQAQTGPALLQLSAQVLMLTATVAAFYSNAITWVYALLLVIRESLVLVGVKFLSGRLIGFSVYPRFNFSRLKSLAASILIIGLAGIFYSTYFHFGTLLIWLTLPAEDLGAYSASLRLFAPLVSLPFMLTLPLLPVFTRLAKSDFATLGEQLSCFFAMALGGGAIITVCGFHFGGDVLALLYGNKYSFGELSSITSVRWLSLAFGIAVASPVIIVSIMALRFEKFLLFVSLCGMVVNLLACLTLLKSQGFNAAAISVAAGFFVLLTLGVIFLVFKKILKHWPTMLLCLLPSALLFFIFQFISVQSHSVRLAIGAVMATIALAYIWRIPRLKRARLALKEFQLQDNIANDHHA